MSNDETAGPPAPGRATAPWDWESTTLLIRTMPLPFSISSPCWFKYFLTRKKEQIIILP
jgi:hypothetical protein